MITLCGFPWVLNYLQFHDEFRVCVDYRQSLRLFSLHNTMSLWLSFILFFFGLRVYRMCVLSFGLSPLIPKVKKVEPPPLPQTRARSPNIHHLGEWLGVALYVRLGSVMWLCSSWWIHYNCTVDRDHGDDDQINHIKQQIGRKPFRCLSCTLIDLEHKINNLELPLRSFSLVIILPRENEVNGRLTTNLRARSSGHFKWVGRRGMSECRRKTPAFQTAKSKHWLTRENTNLFDPLKTNTKNKMGTCVPLVFVVPI